MLCSAAGGPPVPSRLDGGGEGARLIERSLDTLLSVRIR